IASVSLDRRTWVNLQQMVAPDTFEQLLEASLLFCRNIHNQQKQVNIADLQSEVSSQKSYQQRKEEIERKSSDNKSKATRRIRELQSRIAALRTTKFSKLLRLHSDRTQTIFENFGENGELARYLVLEGYLDDTYYQYTSLFHAGRLSP